MNSIEANPIELALAPGTFIRDGACLSFVGGLEKVSAKIGDPIMSNAARAIALYEAFLANCAAAGEEDKGKPRNNRKSQPAELR